MKGKIKVNDLKKLEVSADIADVKILNVVNFGSIIKAEISAKTIQSVWEMSGYYNTIKTPTGKPSTDKEGNK